MTNLADAVADALDSFRIELPSWGFANTGTRFGKFLQPAAAATIEEKFSDAAQVHALTGACPTLALHVLWDFPSGLDSVATVAALADRHGVRPGSINPNVFEGQEYKHGTFANPDASVRRAALHLARCAGPRARVLVDTGHHYSAQNIEQIVAWLLDERMLGGFHFNDRRYADDDLTLGSIDPYQVFRIFHEIRFFEWETGGRADVAYMIDQSHNLKGKIEAMIQTVAVAQQIFARAALVDHAALAQAQSRSDLVAAEMLLQDAFATDVRPAIAEWRRARGLPADPLAAFRESGYLERITEQRRHRAASPSSSYA